MERNIEVDHPANTDAAAAARRKSRHLRRPQPQEPLPIANANTEEILVQPTSPFTTGAPLAPFTLLDEGGEEAVNARLRMRHDRLINSLVGLGLIGFGAGNLGTPSMSTMSL